MEVQLYLQVMVAAVDVGGLDEVIIRKAQNAACGAAWKADTRREVWNKFDKLRVTIAREKEKKRENVDVKLQEESRWRKK